MCKWFKSFCIFLAILNAHGQHNDFNKGEIVTLGGGSGAWTFPRNCVEFCRHVEWSPVEEDDEMFLQFTLTGSRYLGYMAMALSADNEMGNDDTYICSKTSTISNTVVINSAHLTGFTIPIFDSPITDLPGNSAILTEQVFTCTFRRPLNVSKIVSGIHHIWDVSISSFYILFAAGAVTDDGDLKIHYERTSTPSALNLITGNTHDTNNTLHFEGLVNTNLSVPVSPKDEIINIEPYGSAWYIPTEECPFGDCNSIQWRKFVDPIEGPMIAFTLMGSSRGWIGMAISHDREMGDDDCYYCARLFPSSSTIQVISAFTVGRERPATVARVPSSRIHQASIEGDLMICSFLRPVNVTKFINGRPVTWDLSNSLFNLLYAEGEILDGNISYHTVRSHTNKAIYLLSNEGYKAPNPPFDETTTTSETEEIFLIYLPEPNIKALKSGGTNWTLQSASGCSSFSRYLIWEPLLRNNEFSIKITISGTGKDYIGFRIATNTITERGDCYYCIRNSSNGNRLEVKSGYCSHDFAPRNLEALPIEEIVNAEESDNGLTCTFYRPWNVRKPYNGDIVSFNLAFDSYVVMYEEGTLPNQYGLVKPLYRAYTPDAFTIINSTLFYEFNNLEKKKISPNSGGTSVWKNNINFILLVLQCFFLCLVFNF